MQYRIYRLVNAFFIITHCSCAVYNNSIISPFRNVVFTNSSIYIGGKGGIVVLNRENLSEANVSKIYSNNWLLIHFDDNKEIIQCNEDTLKLSHCRKLTESLVDEKNRVINMIVNITLLPVSTMVKVPYDDIDIVVIAATSVCVSNNTYGIVSMATENLTLFLTEENKKGPLNIELGQQNNIVFKSTFQHDYHVYFLFQLWANERISSSKIGKLCLYQNISKSINDYYHSYEDLKLKCTYNSKTFQQIEHGIVHESFLIAVFIQDNVSIVCLFHWNTIATDYIAARKKFSCSDISLGEKYFLPFINLTNSCENKTCIPKACEEINDTNFCNTYYQHTFSTSAELTSPGAPLYIVNGLITTINVIRTLIYSFIYVGTDNGQVGRVDFRTNAKMELLPNFRPFDITRVIQIRVEQDSLHVVTENKVQKVDFESCSIHNDCLSCIMSQNPYCGWDYSTKQCHSNETNSWWWIPSTAGSCIQINNLTYYNKISKDQVTLIFTVASPKWVQERINTTLLPQCKVNGTVIPPRSEGICSIPLNSTNTNVYTFSILYQDVVVAEQLVEFYKCDDFKSCIKCTRRPCSWHLNNFTCVSDDNGIKDAEKCPRINSIDTAVKVSWSMKLVNYSISVYGFDQLTSAIDWSYCSCELVHSSGIVLVSTAFDSNSSLVTCLLLQLNHTGKYTVRLKYGDYYFDNEAAVDVYTCDGLLADGDNCSRCNNLFKDGYKCGWCNYNSRCYDTERETCTGNPTITKIFPTSGPLNGGTVLTLTGNVKIGDVIKVMIDGLNCADVSFLLCSNNFTCKTSKAYGQGLNGTIRVYLNGTTFSTYGNISFSYTQPTLDYFQPDKGIIAGNTKIKITGSYIGYQGPNRYKISFCNEMMCLQCRIYDNTKIEINDITCETDSTTTLQNMTRLEITIDGETNLTLNKPFYYLSNPNIVLSNETQSVQQSGGATIKINGEGFLNVGEITIDKVNKSCEVRTDTTVICETPAFVPQNNHTSNEPVKQTLHVNFDGLGIDIVVNYVGDPNFEKFPGIYQYDKESTIQIKGRNILRGAKKEDYFIQIGLDGRCYITDITMERITCYPPKNVPRTNQLNTNIVLVVVEVGRITQYIGDLEYKEEVEILPIVVGVLGSAFVIVVVVGVTIILIMRKKRKKAKKQFKMELISREEMIRKASREEFADAQMTIRDIKTDLVTSRVPYCSYQTYICHQLFPNLDAGSSPLLQSMITNDNKTTAQSAMDKFDKLLTNKLFLKSLVQTLDRQNKLTVQEKAHLSSILSIALLGNMRLFYDLINCLLSDMIETTSTKQQKVLFRRFESITQRLVANWLQISMYEQLKSQSGLQLFLLYKAVQTVTEKAPIDAVTGNSKNTLAEEKLLKMRLEYEPLTLQIDLNGNSDQHFPVKVLDCDTISQVKRKCCLQIYKNKPISEIPDNDELTLEWHHGKAGKHTLNDIDNINERIDGLVRLNTLKHYMVEDNSTMALMYKDHEESDDPYANSATLRSESVSSDNINLLFPESNDSETLKWHLENLPDDVKSNIEHDIGDIFLNRLFHTKLLLTDYIDTTFEGLMDPQSLSLPVRYFLCMLDKLGKDADVDDDVLQAWKSECYATRMWAPLIGKPQIIFDVDVPNHVEPCMDILKHVFVESFTQTPHKVNKDSPPQKLLFHKDIPRYRKLINPFFMHVEPVTNQEFWSAMENLSEIQKRELKFSREATISQLYNLYVGKYKDEIISDFNEMTDSKDLGFANKLEEVIELVEDF